MSNFNMFSMYLSLSLLLNLGLLSACHDSTELNQAPTESDARLLTKGEDGKTDASATAIFLDFTFEGEMLSSLSYDAPRLIEQQLLFTVGQLNGDKAVGRLDKLKLDNIVIETQENGDFLISYKASLLVAWSKDAVPESYMFTLPYDLTWRGLESFTDKYKAHCVSWGAHDVDQGSIWYYYRPSRYGCELAEGEFTQAEATVKLSPVMTTGRYPEYHKVWEDEVLEAVVVFGHADEESEIDQDLGFHGFQHYHELLVDSLRARGAVDLKVTPEVITHRPSADQHDIVVEATLPDGKRVKATALLVDNVRTAGESFDLRYEALSRTADLIVYNGHAGLGANVRALANKGDWVTGQYSVVFMNGCDTYAYVDEALFEAHAEVNPDDPTGRGYVDVVNNAMPSYFFSMPQASMALIDGLLSYDSPLTYEEIFARVDREQVILVTGEEDNVFVPGYHPDAPPLMTTPWAGLLREGQLSQGEEWRFSTPALEPGTYRFMMEGTGDADLYIRIGHEPTVENFDCRPYSVGSVESCEVELSTPAQIHGMVRGWYGNPRFVLSGGVLK